MIGHVGSTAEQNGEPRPVRNYAALDTFDAREPLSGERSPCSGGRRSTPLGDLPLHVDGRFVSVGSRDVGDAGAGWVTRGLTRRQPPEPKPLSRV
jgi:hypothetical protein